MLADAYFMSLSLFVSIKIYTAMFEPKNPTYQPLKYKRNVMTHRWKMYVINILISYSVGTQQLSVLYMFVLSIIELMYKDGRTPLNVI